MALFGKKTVNCAICGKEVKSGFLRGLFQREIEGQYVCDDCYGEVDLPTSFTVQMTLNQLREYKAFQAENRKLKEDFRITEEVDFGFLDDKFYFDTIHNRMCRDKELNKTIFEGKHIHSFVIKEDDYEIFRGNRAGLITSESKVRQQVMRMEPMVRLYRMEMKKYEDRMERASDDQKDAVRNTKPQPHFETHPFRRFCVEIQLDHPYWQTITAELNAPDLDSSSPDVNDYLRRYMQCYTAMHQLANALMAIAFQN